ncbi:hypothetical protein LTR62_006053 [Meristemomyces frigidus]|uniref:Uncharacterized protein n=1 Tax=Meristemomyces frigidus TaxID=1508187 RepID=A0AAN7TCJ6_9PEZI|nr:hypothetical protein LTR62_006053 [Meristemomyces frigidus]
MADRGSGKAAAPKLKACGFGRKASSNASEGWYEVVRTKREEYSGEKKKTTYRTEYRHWL